MEMITEEECEQGGHLIDAIRRLVQGQRTDMAISGLCFVLNEIIAAKGIGASVWAYGSMQVIKADHPEVFDGDLLAAVVKKDVENDK